MAVSKCLPRRRLDERLRAAASRSLAVAVFALLCMLLLAAATPAGAAGLLDWLFKPKAEQSPPIERPKAHPARPMLPKFSPSEGSERRAPPVSGSSAAGSNGAGGYQTMCVRLCDGYYWPVRYGVSSRDLRKDRQFCSSSCHSDSELFYRSTESFDIANMRDLGGRPYKKLANAFRYREKYDPACRCQDEPWSRASEWRHSSYAMVDRQLLPADDLKAASWNATLAVEPTDHLIVEEGVNGSAGAIAGAVPAADIDSLASVPEIAGDGLDFELSPVHRLEPSPAGRRAKSVARKASPASYDLTGDPLVIGGAAKSSVVKSGGTAKLVPPARPQAEVSSWKNMVYRPGKL